MPCIGWTRHSPSSHIFCCFHDCLTTDSEPWLSFALSFVLWFITQCTANLIQWFQASVQLHVLTYSEMKFLGSFMLKHFWYFWYVPWDRRRMILKKILIFFKKFGFFGSSSRKNRAFFLLKSYYILAHFPFSSLRLCCKFKIVLMVKGL